jgi:hypothetical protein
LKGTLIAALLSTIMIGSFIVPVMAQGGVTAGFTIQVTFFYVCIGTLTNVQVVISDQTGRVVATAVSPDGRMLPISFRVNVPEYWLIVSATGYGSFSYNLPWMVHGSSIIAVQNAEHYYYATILLRTQGSPASVIFGS